MSPLIADGDVWDRVLQVATSGVIGGAVVAVISAYVGLRRQWQAERKEKFDDNRTSLHSSIDLLLSDNKQHKIDIAHERAEREKCERRDAVNVAKIAVLTQRVEQLEYALSSAGIKFRRSRNQPQSDNRQEDGNVPDS